MTPSRPHSDTSCNRFLSASAPTDRSSIFFTASQLISEFRFAITSFIQDRAHDQRDFSDIRRRIRIEGIPRNRLARISGANDRGASPFNLSPPRLPLHFEQRQTRKNEVSEYPSTSVPVSSTSGHFASAPASRDIAIRREPLITPAL